MTHVKTQPIQGVFKTTSLKTFLEPKNSISKVNSINEFMIYIQVMKMNRIKFSLQKCLGKMIIENEFISRKNHSEE